MKRRHIQHILFSLALAFSLFGALTACSVVATADEKNGTDGKAQLSLSVAAHSARSLLPTDVTADDISSIYFMATKPNDAEPVFSYTWWSDTEKSALENMQADTALFIDAGTYDFSLELYNNQGWRVQTGALKNHPVVSGKNTLAFETSYIADETGDLELYIIWTADQRIEYVKAGLFTDESDGEDAVYDMTRCYSYPTDDTETAYTAEYRMGIPAGTYFLRIDVYGTTADGGSAKINTLEDVVRIASGCVTKATIPLTDVNTVYTIDYKNTDGTDFSEWAAGYEPVRERNAHKIVALPTAKNVYRAGFQFDGWFASADDGETLVGEAVERVGAGTVGDKIYYATWTEQLDYYVAAPENGGSDTEGLGTRKAPFETIAHAVEVINGRSDPTKDYVIYVIGTVTGNQTISDAVAAAQLTLAGATGLDSDGNPQDALDAQNTGITLTINAVTVPITVQNLKITGGNNTNDNGGGIRILNSTVTLGSGAVISRNTAAQNGGGVWNSASTLTIDGAKISGNTANQHGGGIYNCSDATLVFTRGEITGNEATKYGGGVYNARTFTMRGGTISGNKAESGAGVNAAGGDTNGTFTMSGGEISANEATTTGGGVYVYSGTFTMEGDALIPAGSDGKNDVYLESENTIAIADALASTATVATITLPAESYQSGTKVLDGTTALVSANYTKFKVADDADGNSWSIASNGTLALSTLFVAGTAGDLSAGDDSRGNGTKDKPYKTLARALYDLSQEYDYKIYISGGVSYGTSITLPIFGTIQLSSSEIGSSVKAKSVSIASYHQDYLGAEKGSSKDSLNGNGNNAVLTVSRNIPVTISNLTVTGGKGGIVAQSGANVTITGSYIAKNSGTNGAGVSVESGAKVAIEISSVANNTATANGGGIYSAGTLTITDSTISGNGAKNGAGIYIAGGNVTFKAGDESDPEKYVKIQNNTATANGGGIYVADSWGGVALDYVTITGNKAVDGAGLYDADTVRLQNPVTISGNTATGNGGGIFQNDGAELYSYNTTVTISGNTAAGDGGGVYLANGNGDFTATVNSNNAANGGGISLAAGTLSFGYGMTIAENTASASGGGIYSAGTLTIADGNAIRKNTASTGGGVYVEGGTLTMSGGEISGNTADKDGDGVYLRANTFSMSDKALVASDNAVYLATGMTITVGDSLTASAPVATITLPVAQYVPETQVLGGSADLLASEHGKFSVAPDTNGNAWTIDSEGKLRDKITLSASDSANIADPSVPYVITGDGTNNSQIDINNGGTVTEDATYYITLDHVTRTAGEWASGMFIYNTNPGTTLTVYITLVGENSIVAGKSHGGLQVKAVSGATVNVIFMTTTGGSLFLDSQAKTDIATESGGTVTFSVASGSYFSGTSGGNSYTNASEFFTAAQRSTSGSTISLSNTPFYTGGITVTVPTYTSDDLELTATSDGTAYTFTAKSGYASYAWAIDDSAETTTTSTYTKSLDTLSEGSHTLLLIATDASGKAHNATIIVTVN